MPKRKPTFAENLLALMAHVPDLSYRELDRLAGLGANFSSGIASGARKNPGETIAKRIAPVLGVPWPWLLGEGGDLSLCGEITRAAVTAALHAQTVTLARPAVKKPAKPGKHGGIASAAEISVTERKKFESRIDKSGGLGACWMWRARPAARPRPNATPGRFVYGQMKIGGPNGKTERSHRIAYVLANGTIPPGVVVMHSCDRPGCCNPAHLSIGSHGDNARDCVTKGRCGLIPGNNQYAGRARKPRSCKECGARSVHTRCNKCAKDRRDKRTAKATAPAEVTS